MSTTWARLGIIAVAPIAALAQDEAPGAPPEGSPWVEPSEGIEGGEQVEVADPAEPVEVAAEAAAVGRPAPSPPRGGTTVALSAGGGFDFATRQPWLGLNLAFQPDQLRGFAFAGRVQAGWGFGDQRPLGVVQLGFAGVVPAEHTLVRLGVLAHTELYAVDYPLPLQIGGDPEEGTFGHLGFLPGGLLLAELGWTRGGDRGAAAWSIGLRLGAGLVPAVEDCETVGAEVDELCFTSRPAILGGISARLRFHEGVYLEALAGPAPMVSLGYAFPAGVRRAR